MKADDVVRWHTLVSQLQAVGRIKKLSVEWINVGEYAGQSLYPNISCEFEERKEDRCAASLE